MTILYITPDQKNIETIGNLLYLKYQKHRVIFAADGIDSLVHISNNRPDITIIDTNIPAIHLSVIINELSKQNKLCQTIFIHTPNKMTLINYDFEYFLPNPVNPDKLCMMIDTIVVKMFFEEIP